MSNLANTVDFDIQDFADKGDLITEAIIFYYVQYFGYKKFSLLYLELDLVDDKIYIKIQYDYKGTLLIKEQQNPFSAFMQAMINAGVVTLE